jgi:hypothetical protein
MADDLSAQAAHSLAVTGQAAGRESDPANAHTAPGGTPAISGAPDWAEPDLPQVEIIRGDWRQLERGEQDGAEAWPWDDVGERPWR